MRTSESIKALAPALTAALGKLEGAAKNAKNPHFKNTYADLASVVDASRSILAESDLAVMQSPGLVIEGRLQLFTRIIHKSGEWIEGEFHMPLAKSDPQATLATLTYARRGALMAILGIPAVDDDGETAVGRGTDGNSASKPRQQPANQTRVPSGLSVHAEGKDWWNCDGFGPSAAQAKRDGLGEIAGELRNEITGLTSATEWREWCRQNTDRIRPLPMSWRVELRNHAEAIAADLGVDLNTREAA
jgi:hypothetical protein